MKILPETIQLLQQADPDSAYSRDNSLKKRLDSFIRGLELRQVRFDSTLD